MQILGFLCMNFDAAVVFVTNFSLLFRLTLAILCLSSTKILFRLRYPGEQPLQVTFLLVCLPFCFVAKEVVRLPKILTWNELFGFESR